MGKNLDEGFSNNANNFMAQNVVDNGVRFQGHAEVKRNVMKGANIVLRKIDAKPLNDKFDNLDYIEIDLVITDTNIFLVRNKQRNVRTDSTFCL